jgi:predicted lipase
VLGAISPNQTYVLGDILPYARLAFAAYCPNPFNFTCTECPPLDFLPVSTFYNESTNMFAYIGIRLPQTDPPEIIIAFRGTQFSSLLNWIYNLQFPKVIPYRNYPGMAVHEGFWEAYESIHIGIEFWIRQLLVLYPTASITVTGHSLGGAMATLCATEIKAGIDTKLNVSLVTFGSPRVGNVDYSALFSTICNITWRVVHYRDIVPHLPPRSSDVLQFWHVAQEIWYDQENSSAYYVADQTGEDPNGSDSIWDPWSIPDHLDYFSFCGGSQIACGV